ncbi:MAG: AMP-binding protein [Bacteroidales bacterium]|nr:AMP-binding protein [Bacteroidales bacterium]
MKGIIEILLERNQTSPNNKLFHFVDYSTEEKTVTEVTAGMVFENAKAIAAELQEKGAKKGDRVVIFSMQDAGTLYAVYGAMMAGTIFTVIPPPIDEGKIERFVSVVASCKPKFVISNYALEQQGTSAQQSTQQTSNIRSQLSFNKQRYLKKQLLRQAFFQAIRLKRIYTDRITPTTREFPLHQAGPDEVIYLQYTSGSTSEPKGVMVTLKNLMIHMAQVQEIYDYSTGSTLAMWVPFFHNLGLLFGVFLPIMALEGKVYFLQTLQFLQKPTLWLRLLSEYRVKLTLGPNTAYALYPNILTPQAAASFDLSHTSYFLNGSEFIDPVTLRAFAELFGIQAETFACGYGMAENVCLVTAAIDHYKTLWVEEEPLRKNRFVPCESGQGKELVSLGEPLKGITMMAVDPATGKPCEEGQVGEMYIRGDTVSQGYWGKVKDNENFKVQVEGHDGYFFKTGDMGILYQGDFYMTDRIKEILVINGHNVYPGDIKAALRKNIPALSADSAVFFTVEAKHREAVVACIEMNGSHLDPAALAVQVNRIAARMFEFSFYDVVFVKKDSLPRTDNRKVRTHKVKELYLQGMLNRGSQKSLTERVGEQLLPGMSVQGTDMLQVLFSSRSHDSARGRDAARSRDAAGSRDSASASALARENSALSQIAPDGIHEKVKAVFNELLEREDYDPNAGFLELGGDSLRLVECVCRLEETFHIKLDVNQISLNTSVNGITELIENYVLEGNGNVIKIDLHKECTLDPSIAPQAPYEHSLSGCKHLFLTGSTGFLGAFLIRSLIEQHARKGFRITCHVRAQNKETGKERIINNMKHYRCWRDEYAHYIQVVTGSLDQPMMGIKEDVYQELSRQVDAVYHNGALLNFLFPYTFMKETNVDGTRECLRFACTGKAKYFHYISSYSVYDTPSHLGKKVFEADPLTMGEGFSLGYSETKWVSEKLVQIARERGLKACIYRPGDITGDTVNGIWEMKDLLSRLIVGCIHLQKSPKIKTRLHIVPVDYVSDAIARISMQDDACGLAFNILGPESVDVKTMVKAIRRMGYKNRIVPYENWRNELMQTHIRENPLRVLASLFPKESTEDGQSTDSLITRFGPLQPRYDMTNTHRFLKNTRIPKLLHKKRLVSVYLKYFKEQEYF